MLRAARQAYVHAPNIRVCICVPCACDMGLNAISLHRGVASIEAEEAVASSLFADLDKPSRVQPRKKNVV